jgi:FKBP-type peptidyl-prolyl cis-trans isomerase (trigger factor)
MAKTTSKTKTKKTAVKSETKSGTKKTKKSSSTQEKKQSLISKNDKITIKIPWSQLKAPYEKTLTDLAKKMKIEGFRQGKVPLKIAEKQISLEKVAESMLRDILPKKYIEALKEAKKQPITAPEYHLISIKKGEEWVLEAHFAEAPQIDLKNYEKYIKSGKKAAEEFIKKHNQQAEQKGSKKPTKTNKSSQAKNSKQEKTAKLSPDQEQEIYYQHILRDLVVNIRPSIAELLLRRETQAEFEKFKEQLASYKISVEKYLEQRQINLEQLGNEMAGTVLNRLQIDFILAAIAKERQLKVDDKALEKALAEIKDEKLREQIANNEQYLASFKAQLLRRQTIENLIKK